MRKNKRWCFATIIAVCLCLCLGIASVGFASAEQTGGGTVEPTALILPANDAPAVQMTAFTAYDTTINYAGEEYRHDIQGVRVPLGNSAERAKYLFNGTFTGDFEIEYAFGSGDYIDNNYADSLFVFYDLNDNELFRVGRYFGGGRTLSAGGAYLVKPEQEPSRGDYQWFLPGPYMTDSTDVTNNDLEGRISQHPGKLLIDVTETGVTAIASHHRDWWDNNGGEWDSDNEVVLGLTGPIGTQEIGKIEDTTIAQAMQNGYKVAICKEQQASHDIVVMNVNGVSLGTQVQYTAVDADTLFAVHPDAYTESGVDVIDVAEGDSLAPFDVYGEARIADGWTKAVVKTGTQACKKQDVPAGSTYQLANPYDATKNYTVRVKPRFDTVDVITAVNDAPAVSMTQFIGYDTTVKVGAGKHDIAGVRVPLSKAANNSEYRINGTFTGEFEVEYAFGSYATGVAAFSFRDEEGNELFQIGRRMSSQTNLMDSAAYFKYKDTYTTNTASYNPYEEWWKNHPDHKPDSGDPWLPDGAYAIPGPYATGDVLSQRPGKITVRYTDKVWSEEQNGLVDAQGRLQAVVTMCHNMGNDLKDNVIVQVREAVVGEIFDADVIEKVLHGKYTVSVCRLNSSAPDVVLTNINGTSLGKERMLYVTDTGTTQWRYNGTTEEIGGKTYIDLLFGEELDTFDVYTEKKFAERWTRFIKTGATHYEGTFADKPLGEYPITVAGVAYTVRVSPKFAAAGDLVRSPAGLPQASMTQFTSYDTTVADEAHRHEYSGVRVPLSESEGKEARYMLAGTFTGDFEVEYTFGSYSRGVAMFVFGDEDGNELFHVGRRAAGDVLSGGMAYLYDGNAFTTLEYSWGEPIDWWKKNAYTGNYPTMADPWGPDYSFAIPGPYITKISGQAEDGVLSQLAGKVIVRYAEATEKKPERVEILVTMFNEGADFTVKNAADQLIGFNRAPREIVLGEITDAAIIERIHTGRYTVAVAKTAYEAPDIVLLKVNGAPLTTSMTGYTLGYTHITYEGFQSDSENVLYVPRTGTLQGVSAEMYVQFAEGWRQYAEVTGEVTGVLDTNIAGEQDVELRAVYYGRPFSVPYSLHVEPSITVTFDVAGGNAVDEILYSEHTIVDLPTPTKKGGWQFDGWFDGATKVETLVWNEELGETRTLQAHWSDVTPPALIWNGDIAAVTTVEKGQAFPIAKTDVTAEDAVEGVITERVTITVTAPDAEPVALDAFTLDPDKFGYYTVTYSVSDTADNAASLTRKIYYVPSRPTIAVSGVPSSGTVGYRITVPTAQTTGEDVTLTRTVMFDGQEVTLTDNTFVPEKEGEYSVVYYAVDAYGSVAHEQFMITVFSDRTEPTLTVEFTQTTATVGERVTLPTATAADDVDGEVQVTVTVTFGDTAVAISDGGFTPDAEGIYRVTYQAVDASGNRKTVPFEVLAVAPAKKGCGCGSVAAGSALGVAIAAFLVVGLGVLLLKRNSNTDKTKR